MPPLADSELNFVRDLVVLLKEQAAGAKAAAASGESFEKGRQLAYYEVLDLIVSQARTFKIEFTAIELEGFDPLREILG